LFNDVMREVEQLAQESVPWRVGRALEITPVQIDLAGGVVLNGLLRDLRIEAQLFCRYTRLNAARVLSAWIYHLALQCCEAEGLPKRTVLFMREEPRFGKRGVAKREFEPLGADFARQRLNELIEAYRLGQRFPLPFFAEASKSYAKTLRQDKPDRVDQALLRAGAVWRGSERALFGEQLALHRVLGAELPVTDAAAPGGLNFAELSEMIFNPLLDNMVGE
jgi:exodeoxyribonuclease V gamma subunit